MTTPISKICLYFDSKFAIFDNTDYFTTVNRGIFAIEESNQLRVSHLTSRSLQLLDAECNFSAYDAHDRHLYYAYYDAGTRKTIVATMDGRLLTDTAKSCFTIWNNVKHVFEKQTSVVKPVMHAYGSGSVMILTDEGLALYHIKDIKASTDTMVEPRSAIALVDASQCIQAFDWYVGGGGYYVVLTAKGMIQYVRLSSDATFSIAFTAQMVEGLKSNAVFSAIACPRYRTPPLVVVAGFDVDRHANMMIVLNDRGDRLSKLDDISNDDGLPIVEMRAYHDNELDVTYIISWSIRSVYFHCLDVKHRLTQIFDRLMDGLMINGVIVMYVPSKHITLTVYGRQDTRGDIVRMKLEWNADEIRKLN